LNDRIILGLRNMEVLDYASPKYVYTIKSVENWLCNTRKYKTVAGGAIFNHSILKFGKTNTFTIFFFMN
jgi:hypothetical protein